MSDPVLKGKFADIQYIAAVFICFITLLFLITVTALGVGFSVSSSSKICESVYIFCASFWLAGKSLLYFWYNEKVPTPSMEFGNRSAHILGSYTIAEFLSGSRTLATAFYTSSTSS